MYVRIGYRLSSLDMGTCARICRLGAILGRGTGMSKIRVNVFRVFRVRHTTHESRCIIMIALGRSL